MDILNVPEGLKTTGRFIVTLKDDQDGGLASLSRLAGIEPKNIMSSLDFGDGGVNMAQMPQDGGVVLRNIGIAIVNTPPAAASASIMSVSADPAILAVEPEGVMYALDEQVGAAASFSDTAKLTWGLQATKVDGSRFTGKGIRIAILDTGLDKRHPDFAGRTIVGRSFIPGVPSFNDGHGHGTHCTGTACGPKKPPQGPRYGVAHGADIYIGKVLTDEGSGVDGDILAGIDWAIANGCRVISMSLGANAPNTSPAYEAVGRRALNRGSLIVAAAGNNATRPGNAGFVTRPANSRTFMAVAAIDSKLRIAPFSGADTQHQPGTEVNIAGPGVAVLSTWPMPTRYRSLNGTSMATPHVAGIAALHAERTGKRGQPLWDEVVANVLGLGLPADDVGKGLAQA